MRKRRKGSPMPTKNTVRLNATTQDNSNNRQVKRKPSSSSPFSSSSVVEQSEGSPSDGDNNENMRRTKIKELSDMKKKKTSLAVVKPPRNQSKKVSSDSSSSSSSSSHSSSGSESDSESELISLDSVSNEEDSTTTTSSSSSSTSSSSLESSSYVTTQFSKSQRTHAQFPTAAHNRGAATTMRQIKVLSESSDESSARAGGGGGGGSDSESSGGSRLINDSASESDSEDERQARLKSHSSDDDDDDDDGDVKKTTSSGVVDASVGVELSDLKKNRDAYEESNRDEGNEDGSPEQRPHSHKTGYKMSVGVNKGDEIVAATTAANNNSNNNNNDDDDGKKDKHKKDKKKRDKKKRKKGKKRKGNKKRRKKKSLKKRIVKLIKKPFKYAKTSIRCTTIIFFILAYIVTLGTFDVITNKMIKKFRGNDFKACDIDVNRVTRSIGVDSAKLSVILKRYSVWDQTVKAIDGLAAGDTTEFDKWYAENFVWNGVWINTTHNIVALYDANSTYLFGDYHVPNGTIQATQKLGTVPEYFKTVKWDLSSVASSSYCGVTKPQGSNATMIMCLHPVFHNTWKDTTIRGYILMTLDLLPRVARYADEIAGCVSMWEDNGEDSRSPDSADVFDTLEAGHISVSGNWGNPPQELQDVGHQCARP